ncbi:fatty acid desaturase [Amylibacter kogurei]|uniref:Fatty acid desaturase n=1 Tax=Paramylibacter kogurei TaxID=1889778 RepID=A0A2G5KAA0_9RHOB|nr:fatty acid desaturase [Amylibacter kogurei]PIB26099.1 fatty acid desaturase [Amylibacter kogurei]
MKDMDSAVLPETGDMSAKDWMRVLAKYRQPNMTRSIFEVFVTFAPFVGLWVLAWWTTFYSLWLTAGVCLVAGGFLVRLFMLQHDCGHGSLFSNKLANDWVGRVIGVFTLTPYDVWRRSHSIHHGASGNLEKRGTGDIHTMTVEEYRASSTMGKIMYRLYRHPITLFFIGPIYVFGFENRLPFGYFKDGIKYWISAMGTNAGIVAVSAILIYFMGFKAFAFVFCLSTFFAAAMGIWLFYVQHQFEETHWDQPEDWDVHDAALYGSSHYVLPGPLRWMTGNIGVHHVHHLYARIPFYRLSEVIKDHPVLAEMKRLTLWESFSCVNLHLWDEKSRRMVRFAEARI